MNYIKLMILSFIIECLVVNGAIAEPINQNAVSKTLANTVSSLGLSILETPGSVQIITKQEITAMGARDLSDILRTVSTIQLLDKFGYWLDTPQIHGSKSGTRLFVDGKEITDAAFGLTIMAQSIPVQKIERIEIMTAGAGTLKYGTRSAGVINVILDKSKTKSLSMEFGLMDSVMGSSSINFTYSDNVYGCDVYLQAVRAESHKSHGTWKEPEGWTVRLYPRFVSEPELFIASVKWNNLEIKGFSQKFMSGAISNWFHYSWDWEPDEEYFPYLRNKTGYTEEWWNQGLSAHYEHVLMPRMQWRTSLGYNYNFSNNIVQAGGNPVKQNWYTMVKEPSIESEIKWQPNDQLDISLGGKYSRQSIIFDNAIFYNAEFLRPTFFNYDYLAGIGPTPNLADSTQIFYYRAYGELTYRSPAGTITLGGSADKNNYSKMKLLPRLAVSNTFGNLALKASFQQSFQDMPPRTWQINPPAADNENPTQEFMTLEGWYQFNPDSHLKLSLTNQVNKGFYLTTDKAYSEFSDIRKNGKMTLQFLDAEYAFKSEFGQSNLGLSAYLSCSADADDYPGFVTPAGTPPGAAKIKASFRHVWDLSKQCTIAPTFYYLSDRYALRTAPDDYIKMPSCLIVNLNMAYKLNDTLRFNAGVFNLTDANEMTGDGGIYTQDSMPGAARQVSFSMTMDI